MINLDKNLLSIIKDKRVALIGPSPYLIGNNLGDYFDSYDVICRPNDIIPSDKARADYGSKTDIMFHNFGDHVLPILEKKIEESEEHFKNLKMICCLAVKARHSDTNFLSWPEDYVSGVVDNFNKINTWNSSFYWIGNKDYRELYNKIGAEPNTGVAAIAILLQYPIKELFVSGFSFYMNCKTYEQTYRDEYHTRCLSLLTDFKKGRKFGFDAGHGAIANKKQIDFFKKNCNDNLIIDSYLNDLLNLNHSRVYQL
jgi:hypothetical protein